MLSRNAHLRNVPDQVRHALGHVFDHDELVELDRLGTLVSLRKDTKLTIEGTPGREAMVVVEGSATVVRDGEPIATIGPGDIVGELSLLSGRPRTATVYADSDVTVYALSSPEFAALLAASPRLERRITRTAVDRLARTA